LPSVASSGSAPSSTSSQARQPGPDHRFFLLPPRELAAYATGGPTPCQRRSSANSVGIGPFSLLTYRDAQRTTLIAQAVGSE
jgi:hypothetical protein